MKRSKLREIKAAYCEIHMLNRVSDATVFDAYIGEFQTNRDFIDYLNSEGFDAIDAIDTDAEGFDAHGNWTLDYSDMALGVHIHYGHYFKRNP